MSIFVRVGGGGGGGGGVETACHDYYTDFLCAIRTPNHFQEAAISCDVYTTAKSDSILGIWPWFRTTDEIKQYVT